MVRYYFGDHLGSARVVTDPAGAILDENDFYPFGAERIVTSTSGNNYKFTGKERDVESGLDYFGARHYASGLGRFLQPDLPLADQQAANPQSWNLYAYARNNPLRYIDPTGRTAGPPIGGPPNDMLPGYAATAFVEGPPAIGDAPGVLFTSVIFSSVNSETSRSTPPYNQLSPIAQQVLANTYGAASAESVYQSWSPVERATFLNNVAAAVDAKFDLQNARLDAVNPFATKYGKPSSVNMTGVNGSKAEMKRVGDSYRSRSNILVGSLEASSLGPTVTFDVDIFNPNSLAAPLHGLEVFWNWISRGATDPWDAARALEGRRVCSGVVPCR